VVVLTRQLSLQAPAAAAAAAPAAAAKAEKPKKKKEEDDGSLCCVLFVVVFGGVEVVGVVNLAWLSCCSCLWAQMVAMSLRPSPT
jgi:hypothetical protein